MESLDLTNNVKRSVKTLNSVKVTHVHTSYIHYFYLLKNYIKLYKQVKRITFSRGFRYENFKFNKNL